MICTETIVQGASTLPGLRVTGQPKYEFNPHEINMNNIHTHISLTNRI